MQSKDSVHTGDGSVNVKGELSVKRETGTWKSCPFILGDYMFHHLFVVLTNNIFLVFDASHIYYNTGTFFCERLAYYGIATNLVTYLTTKLHEGTVSAAKNVTTFQGTCYLTPLIGSFFADTYLGRYWTIAVFYGIYLIVKFKTMIYEFLIMKLP